jgi:sugar phosphate isomerase/epimerase
LQIGPDGFFHLTYCSKIHPGRGWQALSANLRAYAPRLKARLSPHRPFGLGLRLSAAESQELLSGDNLERFQDFLAREGLYVFTLNGFPYGALDGPAVKAQIFAPDWREEARLTYTLSLIEILRRLLPPGVEGGISTMPLSYKPWMAAGQAEALSRISGNLARVAAKLVQLREEEGCLIHLDLEPEPDGELEHSGEVVRFYRDWLLKEGAARLAQDTGISLSQARRHLLTHIRICLDTCHLAVEFEDPEAALMALAAEGIQIGKVQITAGLEVSRPPDTGSRAEVARQLTPFTRSPYLHQVITRGADGARRQFRDLADALDRLETGAEEVWRIHYHMPLFVDRHGLLASTRGETGAVLRLLRERGFARHLEIETYTWEWLPPGLKLDLLESLHREYLWVLEAMGVG